MTDLGLLLCGHDQTEGTARIALEQLRASIERFWDRAIMYLRGGAADEAISFGPFCARVLLENGCAALVGRLDAFRLMYLSEFQSQPTYDLAKRAKSSFSWTGDVLVEDKSSNLWSVDREVNNISRALLSAHCDHIYWKPAAEKMLDFIAPHSGDPAFADLLTIDPEKFARAAAGQSRLLYSTLSKGVHWEFFSTTLVSDETTVQTSIRESCLLMAQLGLVSHFIPTAYASLNPQQAVDSYLALRKFVP